MDKIIAPFGAYLYAQFNTRFLRPTDTLKLPARPRNCLRNISKNSLYPWLSWNVSLLGDLVQLQEGHLLRVPNCGAVSVRQIKHALGEIGMHLGMKIDGWPRRDGMV